MESSFFVFQVVLKERRVFLRYLHVRLCVMLACYIYMFMWAEVELILKGTGILKENVIVRNQEHKNVISSLWIMSTVNGKCPIWSSASNDLISISSNPGAVVLKPVSYFDLLYDVMLNYDWLACFLLGWLIVMAERLLDTC